MLRYRPKANSLPDHLPTWRQCDRYLMSVLPCPRSAGLKLCLCTLSLYVPQEQLLAFELRERKKRCLESSPLVPLPTLPASGLLITPARAVSEIQVHAAGAGTEDKNWCLIGVCSY